MGIIKSIVQKTKTEDYVLPSNKLDFKDGVLRIYDKGRKCKRNVNCRISYEVSQGSYKKAKEYLSNLCMYMLNVEEEKYSSLVERCKELGEKVSEELNADVKIIEIQFVEYYSFIYATNQQMPYTQSTSQTVLAQSELNDDLSV